MIGVLMRYRRRKMARKHMLNGAITPLGWASIASEERWTCGDESLRLGRELMALGSARIKGESASVTLPGELAEGADDLARRYFVGWWLGTFPDDYAVITGPGATERCVQALGDFELFGPDIFGLDLAPGGMPWRGNIEGRRGGLGANTPDRRVNLLIGPGEIVVTP